MKNGSTRRVLLASAVAGLFAMTAGASMAQAGEAEKERCYGVNACKGTGDCGGKGHSCAGENECKGKGYLNVPKGLCERIQGGRTTPVPEDEQS